MKHSHIFMQALCLATLMIMTCWGRPPVKPCSERINIYIKTLLSKTGDFIKGFPDKNTSVKLLTHALKEDFMKNCSTRNHLLSFYAENVLSEDKISAEAKKREIDSDFKSIQDMLKKCSFSNCNSTEVTQNIQDLRQKLTENKKLKIQYKAVNELQDLLIWINELIHKMKKNIL